MAKRHYTDLVVFEMKLKGKIVNGERKTNSNWLPQWLKKLKYGKPQ